MQIDSHQHFWRYTPEDFDWIDDSMAKIRRDFLPVNLERELRATGIDAAISVQARTTVGETRWLLELAGKHEFIQGVIGWAPLDSPDVRRVLEELAPNRKLRGMREVCQGQADGFMLRRDFLAGVGLLAEYELAYDILIFESQLAEAIALVDRFPGQTFVLDHIAKPRIGEGSFEAWAGRIGELAERPHVYCKVSGMVTEADPGNWTEAQLRPYFDRVLETFGPKRLMFGSDWPVCLVGCTYEHWHRTVLSFSPSEKADIFGGTAGRAYGLRDEVRPLGQEKRPSS